MTMLRQLHIHPSGCQNWRTGNKTLGSDGHHFGYASTLALYIYDLEDHRLKRMLAGHDRAITGVAWSPHQANLVATISKDGKCSLWNIETGLRLGCLTLPAAPCAIEWSTHTVHDIAIGCENGAIYIVNTLTMKAPEATKQRAPHAAYHIRYNPKQAGLLAIGTVDGQVLILLTSSKAIHRVNVADEANGDKRGIGGPADRILADMQWDPLSTNYMLVAFRSGAISLWDMEEKTELFSFDRTGGGKLSSIAWLPWAAGSFVTANTKTGVLRVFNVSQKQPIEHIRIDTAGITAFVVLPALGGRGMVAFQDGSVGIYDLQKRHMEFLTKAGHTETVFDCAFSPIDSNLLATASYDGSIKLWSIETMKHTKTLLGPEEVIYSISWSPDGHRLLSSSNKGQVLLWDVSTGRILHTYSAHQGQPVLRVDWSTINPVIAASCGSDRSCVIFETESPYRLRHRLRHPGEVYGGRFHPQCLGILVTGCQDGLVRIYDLERDGDEPILVIKGHQARVFSCEWHPSMPSLLATSSDDKTVRLCYLPFSTTSVPPTSSSSERSVKLWEVIGHETAERMNKWKRGGTGGSSGGKGSEADKHTASEVGVMKGHTDRVRGLIWNTELPHILISGSWDSSIRIWDTRTLTCLQAVSEHLADVYGLAQHPHHPFLLVSSSRDTSVRIWLLEELTQKPKMQAVIDPASFARFLLDGGEEGERRRGKEGQSSQLWWEAKGEEEDVVRLRGLASQEVGQRIENSLRRVKRTKTYGASHRSHLIRIYQEILRFFGGPLGTKDTLWYHIRRVYQEQRKQRMEKLDDDDEISEEEEGGEDQLYDEEMIVHEKDIMEAARQEAANLESIRMFSSSSSFGGAGSLSSSASSSRYMSLKRDERLADAAMIHLQAGRLQQYCELQIELNQWGKALAVAPGVKLDGGGAVEEDCLTYWRELCHRYAKHLEDQKHLSEAAVPLYIASNQREKAIDLYVARKEYRKAFLVAKVLKAEEARGQAFLPPPPPDRRRADSNRLRMVTGVAEAKLSSSSSSSAFQTLGERKRSSSKIIDETEESGRGEKGGEEKTSGAITGTRPATTSKREPLLQVADHMAKIQFSQGDSIKSACCYLAVGDHVKAIQTLLRGGEVELAYAVGVCLLQPSEQEGDEGDRERKILLEVSLALAARAELKGHVDLALKTLWRLYGEDEKVSLSQRKMMGLVVARSRALSDTQVNEIYARLGLEIRAKKGGKDGEEPDGDKYNDDDEDDEGLYSYSSLSLAELEEEIERLVLSRQGTRAGNAGFHLLRRIFSLVKDASMEIKSLQRIHSLLGSIDVYALKEKARMMMLTYLNYLAALIGIEKKLWHPMISYLAYNARTLMKHYKLHGDIAVTETTMLLLEARHAITPYHLNRAIKSLEDALQAQSISNTIELVQAQSLLQQLGHRRDKQTRHNSESGIAAAQASDCDNDSSLENELERKMILAGPSIITTTITSRSDAIGTTSVLTGLQIEGTPVVLEDKTSVIALNEAYMLAQVYPFSPLNTGERLNLSS